MFLLFFAGVVVRHEVLFAIVRVRVSFALSSLFSPSPSLSSSDPWSIVSLAFFLRYPNPYASHVISCDVVDRRQTDSGSLLTTRLILKRGTLPRWAPQGIVSRTESWVIEESEVDPFGKVVRCRTKNLDHVKVMQIEETQLFQQSQDGCVPLLRLHSSHLVPTLCAPIGEQCRPPRPTSLQSSVGVSQRESKAMGWHVSKPMFKRHVCSYTLHGSTHMPYSLARVSLS